MTIRLLRCNPTCRVERGSSPEFWPVCLSYLPKGEKEKKSEIGQWWPLFHFEMPIKAISSPYDHSSAGKKDVTFTGGVYSWFSHICWSLLPGQLGENIRRRYFVWFSFSLSFIMIGHNLCCCTGVRIPWFGRLHSLLIAIFQPVALLIIVAYFVFVI